MTKQFLDIVYYLEHRFIPETLFDEEHDLIRALATRENVLYEIFDGMCDEKKEQNPFSPEDFKVNSFHVRDDWFALDITFPSPERTPLCYAMYIFYKNDGSGKGCFTVERGKNEKGIECGFLCEWKQDKSHINYGPKLLSETEARDIFEDAFRIHTGLPARDEK